MYLITSTLCRLYYGTAEPKIVNESYFQMLMDELEGERELRKSVVEHVDMIKILGCFSFGFRVEVLGLEF